MRPRRWQPTRLPRPWDSPGKNTGVGCHFLLQCMKVKSENEVAQSCPTPTTPWTAAHQAPPPMGFSRQADWRGVPLPSPLGHQKHGAELPVLDGRVPLATRFTHSICVLSHLCCLWLTNLHTSPPDPQSIRLPFQQLPKLHSSMVKSEGASCPFSPISPGLSPGICISQFAQSPCC